MTAREHANNIREKLVAQRDRQLLVVANEIIVRLGCIEDVSTRRELAINYSELVNACARPDSVEEIRAILATQESLADKFGLEIEFAAEFPNILGVDIAPLHMAAQAVFTIQEAHFMGQSLRCERNMDA